MDPTTFDRITRAFAARRLSRRQAVTGGAGLAATALAATGINAEARDAPVAPAAARLPEPIGRPGTATDGFAVLAAPAPNATAIATPTTAAAKPLTFLFLQSFAAGSLVPKAGTPGHYLLTLQQGLGDTVYFSDRPAKVVGTVPTERFLQALGFTPANPPNAALVGQRDATHKDVVVVELFDPRYDAAANTLTYEVTLLADWHKLDETFQQTPDDEAHLPRAFTAAHLFIDDCPDMIYCCFPPGQWPNGHPIGSGIPVGYCWNWNTWTCDICDPNRDLNPVCNQTYAACNGQCEAHYAGNVCF